MVEEMEDCKKSSARKVDFKVKIRTEKAAHAFVERLLERDISEKLFLKIVQHITTDHYNDVTEERAILKICGYPLCSNIIKKVKQQTYSIINNKVFEMKERKNFCSSRCYTNSNHIKRQIPTTPLSMRNLSSLKPIILPDERLKLKVGEEVELRYRMKDEEVECLIPDNEEENCDLASDLIKSNIRGLSEHQPKVDIDEQEEPEEEKKEIIKPKTVVRKRTPSKKIIFLEDLPQPSKPVIAVKRNSPKAFSKAIQASRMVMKQWISDKTRMFLDGTATKILLNENKGLQTDENQHEQQKATSSNEEEKVKALEERLDRLVLGKTTSSSSEMKSSTSLNPLPDYNDLKAQEYTSRVSQFFKNDQIKCNEKVAPVKVDDEAEEQYFPTVDSYNQIQIRRKILYQQISKSMIMKKMNVPTCSISNQIQEIISTFRLTSQNLVLKQKEADITAVLLLTLLRKVNNDLDVFVSSSQYESILKEMGTCGDEVNKSLELILEE